MPVSGASTSPKAVAAAAGSGGADSVSVEPDPAVDPRLGRTIAGWTLVDRYGQPRDDEQFRATRLLVLAFLGTECPLAQAYAPRLSELSHSYDPAQVSVVAVMSNCQDSLEEMGQFIDRQPLGYPVLKDPGNVLADRCGTVRTPEIFVLDAKRQVRYVGRIDNQLGIEGGTTYRRGFGVRNYLADAIDDLLAGRAVRQPATQAVGCLLGRERQPDPDSPVTWSGQIARIVQDHCQNCHRPGEIGPFSLLTYADTVGWGEMIAEVVTQRRMPPWGAKADVGHWANDPTLTAEEMELVRQWVSHGCPEGDPTQAPPAREFPLGWSIAEPDLVLSIADEPFEVPAEGQIPYQVFYLDPGWTTEHWAVAVEARPDCRRVIHHMAVYVAPKGEFQRQWRSGQVHEIGGYVPGVRYSLSQPLEPADSGDSDPGESDPPGWIRLPAGSEIVVQMHYTPNGVAQRDRSQVAFRFGRPPHAISATEAAADVDLKVPADSAPAGPLQAGDAEGTGQPSATGQLHMSAESLGGWAAQELATAFASNSQFVIPPGSDDFPVTAWYQFADDAVLVSLHPHMHWRGKACRFIAHYPDTTSEVLLDVDRYDFDWQFAYLLAEPKPLPKGTRVEVVGRFDNSAENLRNPAPDQPVTYGEQTSQEMMSGFLKFRRPLAPQAPAGAAESTKWLTGYPLPDQVPSERRAEYFHTRALLRLLHEDSPGAMADLDQALRQDPAYARALRTRSELLVALEQFDAARADLTAAIAAEPRDPVTYLMRGRLAERTGQTEAALADYTVAIELDFYNHRARYYRAQIWEWAGESQQAIEEYSRLLGEVFPDHPRALLHRGVLWLGSGYRRLAEADFSRLAVVDPSLESEVYEQRGLALVRAGQGGEAADNFAELTRLLPESGQAWVYRGAAEALAGRDATAVQSLERALDLLPSNGVVLSELGRLHQRQQDFPRAIQRYRQALEVLPDDPSVLNNLAWILATSPQEATPQEVAPSGATRQARGGTSAEAVALAQRACELSRRTVPGYLDTLAAALARDERWGEARAAAREAERLARFQGQAALAEAIALRLRRYQAGQPYQDEAALHQSRD